ncbi:hypothetical protein NQ317_010787 [Molorchus minor]|uniref:DDE Tnp4 domain-containing protein n=1 Tax=Molorchus minor TaxID=1323400 RepID=A0ABQ9J5F5_9CUCU|nr:hypothetical protein NQ317_010787 [Molorchus minor]
MLIYGINQMCQPLFKFHLNSKVNRHRGDSVRSIIERCNGVLKNRFRCLLEHSVLHYIPEVVANIVKACVVLTQHVHFT